MKSVLFICAGPFGCLTDTYYQVLLLKDRYRVTYIGLDEGKAMNMDGVKFIHLEVKNNKIKNRIAYFKAINNELKSQKYDFVLINYFVFCSVIRLFSRNRTVVDIRTSFITPNLLKRFLFNTILSFEVRLFKNITIISNSLRKYLYLPKRSHILPLGGPSLPSYKKNFESLNMLYVGTFFERDISKTIFAFSKFINEYKIKAHYTIIGFGPPIETEKINAAIHESGMTDHIYYKGEIRYPELNQYLKDHNIGLSYIPLKGYFECQPPTKTFEYLLSGMAVLATATKENKRVITESTGVTIGDSIEDIYEGLKTIYSRRLSYRSEYIQSQAHQYTWDSIINNNLIPYIESY